MIAKFIRILPQTIRHTPNRILDFLGDPIGGPFPSEKLVNKFIDRIIEREGGLKFTNRKEDRGGPTNAGITFRTYSEYTNGKGTVEELEKITMEEARDFYKWYFKPYISDMRSIIGAAPAQEDILDTITVSGRHGGTKIIQTALTRMGYKLAVDGHMGRRTKLALNKHIWNDDMANLRTAIANVRAEKVVEFVKNRPNQKVFLKGWLNRIRKVAGLPNGTTFPALYPHPIPKPAPLDPPGLGDNPLPPINHVPRPTPFPNDPTMPRPDPYPPDFPSDPNPPPIPDHGTPPKPPVPDEPPAPLPPAPSPPPTNPPPDRQDPDSSPYPGEIIIIKPTVAAPPVNFMSFLAIKSQTLRESVLLLVYGAKSYVYLLSVSNDDRNTKVISFSFEVETNGNVFRHRDPDNRFCIIRGADADWSNVIVDCEYFSTLNPLNTDISGIYKFVRIQGDIDI